MFSFFSKYLLLFSLLILVSTSASYSQDNATPNFGMTVSNAPMGIEITSIEAGRPIAKKLEIGDILESYVVINDSNSSERIVLRNASDIDALKKEIVNGAKVEVRLLRPQGVSRPATSFTQVVTTLDFQDLIEKILVRRSRLQSIPPLGTGPGIIGESKTGVVKVMVYYGTDRLLTGNQYSGDRDPNPSPMKMGYCIVSLPPDHRLGKLEGPKWSRFEFSENPEKHVVLQTVAQIGKEKVFESIQAHFRNHPKNDKRRMLVFIHGYNVSFQDAARRAAQIHYDLAFPGLSSFFSWPSNGETLSYVSDSGDIEWSAKNIAAYLLELSRSENIDELFIIAHSMGNRGLTKALLELANTNDNKKIKEVILAAPDIDSMLFDQEIASKLCQSYPRITVYASDKDRALWASDIGNETPRVGQIRGGNPTILSRANMDIIDASNIETDFLSHSYFGDATSVISDLFLLIRDKKSPGERSNNMRLKNGNKGDFWFFRK